jgi:hypothetical protein
MLLSDSNPKHNSSSADEECNNTPPGNSDVICSVASSEILGNMVTRKVLMTYVAPWYFLRRNGPSDAEVETVDVTTPARVPRAHT